MKFVQALFISCFVFHLSVCKVVQINKEYFTKELEMMESQEMARKKSNDFMSKILPMMVMPFMTSVMMLPMMLIGMKLMLIGSTFLGKLAIILSAVNILRKTLNSKGGLYSHNIHVKHNHPPPPEVPSIQQEEYFKDFEENYQLHDQKQPLEIPAFSYSNDAYNNYENINSGVNYETNHIKKRKKRKT